MLTININISLLRNFILITFFTLFLAACGGSSELVGADTTTNNNASNTDDNDSDGIVDASDNCPGIANANQADSDNDGIGDACDTSSNSNNTSDGDNDGVNNSTDNCPNISNANQSDVDNDGIGDACDPVNNNSTTNDADNDGINDASDNCPNTANANQTDVDNDGVGDACDSVNNNSSNNTDTDNDGVVDTSDNCPNVSNNDQADADNNGVGDACDSNQPDPNNTDSDNDGYVDATDNCPGVANPTQADADNDGIGDACDTVNSNNNNNNNNTDSDNDGFMDNVDNCPANANPTQADVDADGIGDACDSFNDTDGDGVEDSVDNCIAASNADQADADNDGIGDVCDGPTGDAYAATPNIVDSFGQVVSPDVMGPPWMAINSHYATYPPASGECSQEVHSKYWVQSPEDGKYYPTWHPAVDSSGCSFGHEHGDDPRGADLYEVSGGIPFGFVHSRLMNMGGMGDRQEDHVGHKVVTRDNWIAVDGNPVNDGDTYTELGAGFECDWLSKVHQGTHSSDALGNNMHEYFLNLDCADGTYVVIKELAVWGAPSRVFNECSNNGDAHPSGDPYLNPGLIDVGFVSSDTPPVYAEDPNPENNDDTETGFSTNDGKREFGCFEDKINGFKDLMELWKPDGVMRTPESGSVHFSPYYITKNSTRYVDPNWQQHSGWTNGFVNTVDMCVKGSRAWDNTLLFTNPEFATNGQYPPFCALNNLSSSLRTQWENEIATIKASGQSQSVIDAALTVAENERRLHPDNPFDGSRRVSHPKRIQIYNNNATQNTPEGRTRWCSNAWGKSPVWPLANGDCPTGTIQQIISSSSNGWDGLNISGSSLNSTQVSSGDPQDPNDLTETLTAPGIGEEWIRDQSNDSQIHGPN